MQALHMFFQEHGHPPLTLNRNHAEEVMRLGEEFMEATRNVPRDYTLEPQPVDKILYYRVCALARLNFPPVAFQLGGLAAAEVNCWIVGHNTVRIESDSESLQQQPQTGGQWYHIDVWPARGYGIQGLEMGDSEINRWPCFYDREDTLDTLHAWLGLSLASKVKSAKIALIGCDALGQDVARCLAAMGACIGPQGRLIAMDCNHINPAPASFPYNSNLASSLMKGLSVVQTGIGVDPGFCVQSFEGCARCFDHDPDLWEGVDAVVVCMGRDDGYGKKGNEELLRFLNHKCVLHKKPLVWGWAGGTGEGGGGVEVVIPGQTCCLSCSTHGGLGEIEERRTELVNASRVGSMGEQDVVRPEASASDEGSGVEADGIGGIWDSRGYDWSVGRAAVAGLMVTELVKIFHPILGRSEASNWWLNPSWWSKGWQAVPIHSVPNPPTACVSTTFDQCTGGPVHAIPHGFTEWGVEEVTAVAGGKKEPSLGYLLSLILARFGVKSTSVAIASPGSEFVLASVSMGVTTQANNASLLWAEWQRDLHISPKGGGQVGPVKMEQTVVHLWKQAEAALHLRQESQSDCGHNYWQEHSAVVAKERRFLFLDVRGTMNGEDVILPVIKYWVM
ncbi:unnamed protein product [Choristocarpus tenellus]